MLMGDKYLVWVGPGSVTCTRIVLEHKMQYHVMKISSFLDSKWVKYMQNVFNQELNNKEFSSLVLIQDVYSFTNSLFLC